MIIGALFFGLLLVLCLAYFIFIKAWKQDVMAFKIIGFVLAGLLVLTVLCAPVCMLVGKCGKGSCGGMGCGPGGRFEKRLFLGDVPPGGPDMMYFRGFGKGECPMMGGKADIIVSTPTTPATEAKPGEKVTAAFEMPIWQRAVELMNGNDANIKSFADKVKANPDLLKKLKDALNK